MTNRYDLASLEGILTGMYAVISGPAGGARDWETFHSFYAHGARLMPVVSASGKNVVRVLTPEEYRQRVEPIFASEDFWEREIGRAVEVIGPIAHVLSHYESLHDPNGVPFDTGTNSIQLIHDGSRWWIVSVLWSSSRSA
jgi:hypothetical protein